MLFFTNSGIILSNNFLINSGIEVKAADEQPKILKTDYIYDSSTGEASFFAFFYPGTDSYGEYLVPNHLALTTNPAIPDDYTTLVTVYYDGVLFDSYSPDEWSIYDDAAYFEFSRRVYYIELDLLNIDESFVWDDYYVLLETYEGANNVYTHFDVSPLGISTFEFPTSGDTTIMELNANSVKMRSTLYPGKTISDTPWTLDTESITFDDYNQDDIEILSAVYNADTEIYTIEFEITNLTPDTLYDSSSFSITFEDTLYTGASQTIVQPIPEFTTSSSPVVVPPLVPEEQSHFLIVGMVYLILLILVIATIILLIIYLKKRNSNSN